MISHFFIDRPIFAAVLSIVIMLTGAIALLYLPIAQYPQITPPSVVVSINYPGASAQVVADTVAAPIEQQVNGVEGMLYMSSQAGNDGSYTLTVTFDVETDLNTALVMVQNRVTLALPQLPTEVQAQGITIRKRTPDILLVVSLYSPDNRYDDLYLSNFAMISVRDELLRVDGVADINIFGERDYSIRAWLDPQKMASCGINAGDVATAIRNENIDVPAGELCQPPIAPGQAFQLPLDALGRLSEPEQFGRIVVKVGQGYPLPATSVTPPAASSATVSTTGLVNPLASPTVSGPTGITTELDNLLASTSGALSVVGTASSFLAGSSSSLSISGGSTSFGGANSSGGATIPGGGSTGGAANVGGPALMNLAGGGLPGAISGLSIDQQASAATTAVGGNVAATLGLSPQPPDTALVRLRDLARVEMGAATYTQASTFDSRPAVGVAVFQLPGTNALDVAERVQAKLRELAVRFPDGLAYDTAYDITPFVRESVADVVQTLFEAVLLVGVVVMLFLQSWRSVIIPMVAVPVAIVGTFAAMAAVGFSLNNISLFGLVLAIGIVVDDAIVVVENVERWLAQGLPPRDAARKAMEEVTGPVIAVALVLCAVFVPCALVSGITGRFFRQFAVTISVSTLFSAINSLTLSPALAAILLKPKDAADKSLAVSRPTSIRALAWLWSFPAALFRGFNRGFAATTSAYSWTVGRLLHVNVLVLLLYAGLLVLTYWVFAIAPVGFVPEQDQGRIIVSVQLPDAASLERTIDAMTRIEKIARNAPGVAHTLTVAGYSFVQGARGSNFGSMFVVLKPFDERRRPELLDTAIIARLQREWFRQVHDAQVIAFRSPPIPGLGVAGGFKLMVEDRAGIGLATLQKQTDRLVRKLQAERGLVSVSTQFRSNTPELFMDIDRSKVASLGIALGDVNQTVGIYLGSLYVNSFNVFGRDWQVNIQAEGNYRHQASDINLLAVRNNQQQMVLMGTLANVREIGGPIFVNRYNLYAAAPVTGGLRPGVSSGVVIDNVDALVQQSLPLSMNSEWTELMFIQIRAGDTAGYVFALAVTCVFLTLAALYESWALPLAVILVVPLCVLFSVVSVLYTHNSVNIFVQIGLVVLVGLACKNSILIVEFARNLHAQGQPRWEATRDASRLRLRPILMTSLAFVLGVFPLAIAVGAGAEMRRSLGTAVFGGMIGVTLLGIFLTPVFFYVIQGLSEMRLFTSAAMKWIGSAVLGGLAGGAGGYLFAHVGVVGPRSGPLVGGIAGALGSLLVLAIHYKIRNHGTPPSPSPSGRGPG